MPNLPEGRSFYNMFWSRVNPSNFYETIEIRNITFAPSKYQNFDLSISIYQSIGRVLVARDTIVFFLQHLGFEQTLKNQSKNRYKKLNI